MKPKYAIVRIEYREFERFIHPDYRIIYDEVDAKRFDSIEEAESEVAIKLETYKDKGWEFSIIPVYSI